MTLENRTMNSIPDLQFLNLDDASEKVRQDITNILYGEVKKSSVEFPWEISSVGVSRCTKNDDEFKIIEPTYNEQTFPPASEQMVYQPSFAETGYSPVVCMPHGCGFPVHPQTVPMVHVPDPMMGTAMLPMASDSKMYVHQKHPGPSYSDKVDMMDHKVSHRSRKKKPIPKEKYNNYHDPAMDYSSNMMLEEYQYELSHGLQLPSHLTSVPVPVSLTATDQHGLSQQHVSYQCVMAPTLPHGYSAVPPFYSPGPSQMYYPNNMYAMYTAPTGLYHTNYAGHPATNYTHIVPSEPPVPTETLNKVMEMEMSNTTSPPGLPGDMTTYNPVPNQVPKELHTQREAVHLSEPELPKIETSKDVVGELVHCDLTAEDHAIKASDTLCDVVKQSVVLDDTLCKTDNSFTEDTNTEVAVESVDVTQTESRKQAAIPTPLSVEKKTFASLFKADSSPQNGSSQRQLVNHIECATVSKKGNIFTSGLMDTVPVELKDLLSTIQLDHHSVQFLPRGLSNKGNWCYINATLQALLACAPFHNLMRRLPTVIGLKKESSVAPVTEAVVEFVNEFSLLEPTKKTPKTNGKMSTTKSKEETNFGEPFEPKYIFDMLLKSKRDDFAKGRQEDAEEFLTWMLNQVHEEMVKIKSTDTKDSNLRNGDIATPNGDITSNGDDNLDDDRWLMIGPKNKTCATRSLNSSPSPIVDIFGGQICSVLQHASNKSKILEPFFTLQLDIQGGDVKCIKSALEGLAVKETLEGYTCSTTKQEIEASRRITLEKLPSVLILHLKRFVYCDGVIKKLLKCIDFDFDLELSKDLLSHTGRLEKNRSYKLFAVVYHDGQDAAKGHYIADVYHSAYRCWLRADDSKLKSIDDHLVLKYDPPRVPYLLYYRRADTII